MNQVCSLNLSQSNCWKSRSGVDFSIRFAVLQDLCFFMIHCGEFEMRNLLALVGLAVVAFAGFGYSRGWFTLANSDGNLTIQVNKAKTENDIKAGIKEGTDWIGEHKSGAAAPAASPAAKK